MTKRPEKRQKPSVDTFKRFIEDNKDELAALQIIYGKSYRTRHLTYGEIRKLAEAIGKPPYQLTPELVWQAYQQLEKSKVKGAGPQKLLTNIVSLIRFAIGESDVLEPFPDAVNRRFNNWLAQQREAGRGFSAEQMAWLEMIKEHISTSVSIGIDDFESVPFYEKGGAVKANSLFEQQLDELLEELNEVLVT